MQNWKYGPSAHKLRVIALVLGILGSHPASANEDTSEWKLDKKIDKLTSTTSCRMLKKQGPATLEIFQMEGYKNILGAAVHSHKDFNITRFKIDDKPAKYAAPVGILFDYRNTFSPTMNDLLAAKTLKIEYENPLTHDSDIINLAVGDVQKALERLREKDCQ